MDELAAWRVIDVFARRDELSAVLADREIDGDVVLAGTREPIELLDDDVVDVAFWS